MSHVEFCGEVFPITAGEVLVVGREADVVVDEDNHYLHRRFLGLTSASGFVWLENLGSRLSATLADEQGLVQTWLAPGSRVPVVFPRSVVYFTAGPTTYDLEIVVTDPPFIPQQVEQDAAGATTVGRVAFTPDQRLLCLALAEEVLRRGVRGRAQIPPTAQAAAKLGWTTTKFNRKLDNVCEKLAKTGVRGLTSTDSGPASDRRSRLVEYVVASRLIVPEDLLFLDEARDFSRR